MGFFDFFKQPDVHEGVAQYRSTPGAVLLDVRSPQEYREGHIPGSVNLPLMQIADAPSIVQQPDAPLFVYCLSGMRSRQAAALLAQLGYTNVQNIGGIADYSGEVKKG